MGQQQAHTKTTTPSDSTTASIRTKAGCSASTAEGRSFVHVICARMAESRLHVILATQQAQSRPRILTTPTVMAPSKGSPLLRSHAVSATAEVTGPVRGAKA